MNKGHFANRGRIGFRLSAADDDAVHSKTFSVIADDRLTCALTWCQQREAECAPGESTTLRIEGDTETCVCKSNFPDRKKDSSVAIDTNVIIIIVVILLILLLKFVVFPLLVALCMPVLGYESAFCRKLGYFYCHPCESSAACCCILCCAEIPESLQGGGEP